jgi:hypothetical protein
MSLVGKIAAAPSEDGLDTLARAAEAGDAAAMSALGRRMLIGEGAPLDHAAALAWLKAAAAKNEPEALLVMATLAGAGALVPQDWGQALAFLARAADGGAENARAQLRLLAHAPEGEAEREFDDWARLAGQVDIPAWITPPARRILSDTPRVRLAEGFASHAVCDWLIARARGRLREAMMYDPSIKAAAIDPHRTCSDYQFDILNTDLVLILLRARIAAVTGLPTVAMEPPRIFHYAVGQDIKPHYDRCGDQVGGYGRDGGYLGDRIVTVLVYLNDGYRGGELNFPKARFQCKGAKGDAVYFAHIDPAGRPDPLSLHAGLKIESGEKWVLSQWIHDRPFTA